MIRTEYVCDRCGKTENLAQFWTMEVMVKSFQMPHYGGTAKQEQWCRKCVDHLGLLPKYKEDKTVPPTPPMTLEEMIREIIREEGRNDR